MGSLYSEHLTWLHRWSAGVKLWSMAILGSGIFWVDGLVPLAVAAVFCMALSCSIWQAMRAIRSLLTSLALAALLIAGFHAFWGHWEVGVTSALRLACAACLGMALTVTTRSSDLIDVLEQLLRPVQWLGLRPERISLQLALMLRFTEHFFVQWNKLDQTYRLRTGQSGGRHLLAPLIVQLLQTSRRVADALFLRLGP